MEQKLKVQFLAHDVENGKANYIINVKYNGETWIMKTRYSKLYQIHQNLKQINPSVPNFPKKKFFGNLKESFLSQRQKSLEHYVVAILKNPNKYNSTPLVKFLMKGRKLTNRSVVSTKTDSSSASNQKPKNHLEEIYKSYTKALIQIPKKNENFLFEGDERKKKSCRTYLNQKKCTERKKEIFFFQSEDIMGNLCPNLDSVLPDIVKDINEVISEEVKLLDRNEEFVYDISKMD